MDEQLAGNRAGGPHHKGHPMNTTYRIKRIADPRSRGVCYWFEILAQRGEDRWSVATYDTREEARTALAQIRAATAAAV
jgi:hypothetical protein